MGPDALTAWNQQWPDLSKLVCKLTAQFGRGLISIDELDFLSLLHDAFSHVDPDIRDDLQANIRNEKFYAEVLHGLRSDLAAAGAHPSHPRLLAPEQAISLLIFAQALSFLSKRSVQESPTNQSLVRECTDACEAGTRNSPLHDVAVVEAAAFVAPNESVRLAAEIGWQDTSRQRKVAEMAARTGWSASVPLIQEWARSSTAEASSLLLVCAAMAGAGTSQDRHLTKQALQAVKQGRGTELENLADWVVDRSKHHDDQAVLEILHLLSVKFPAGFNPLEVTCEVNAQVMGCSEPRHWPNKIRMNVEESPWPVGSRFLSGAACAAGLPDYAFALACHEYLHWEQDHFSWSSTTGVAGPLLVLAMTARSADIREGCLNSLRDLLMRPIDLSSPSLRLSRSYVAARHYSDVGNIVAARTAIREAVLLACDPIRTTSGWHGLPVSGYEIFDSRLRPELDDVWGAARELGVEPTDLTTTPAQKVLTMLELARESLAPEGTARPDHWVAKALLLTAEEGFDRDVIKAWAGSTDLVRLSTLYLHEHPAEHDNLMLWSAFGNFLDAAGTCEHPRGFGPRSAAIQEIILNRLTRNHSTETP